MSAPWNAIRALRGEASERECHVALRSLSRWLDARFGGDPLHADARQETLLKVFRSAPRCRADSPRSAERWVRTVYENAQTDLWRKKPKLRDPSRVEEGPSPSLVLDDHVERMTAARDEFFDLLDAHLDATFSTPPERANARRRAEVAWLRHVEGLAAPDIRSALIAQGEDVPSDAALYKWVERGRERVLLPFLDGLLEEGRAEGLSEPVEAIARELLAVLLDARRADTGKARPSRRKAAATREDGSGVSPREDRTSVQYADPSARSLDEASDPRSAGRAARRGSKTRPGSTDG